MRNARTLFPLLFLPALLPSCDRGIAAEAPVPSSDVTRVILGPLNVEYSVRSTSDEVEGHRLEGATRIELHDRYVVFRDRDGNGILVTLERLVSLKWKKA